MLNCVRAFEFVQRIAKAPCILRYCPSKALNVWGTLIAELVRQWRQAEKSRGVVVLTLKTCSAVTVYVRSGRRKDNGSCSGNHWLSLAEA